MEDIIIVAIAAVNIMHPPSSLMVRLCTKVDFYAMFIDAVLPKFMKKIIILLYCR